MGACVEYTPHNYIRLLTQIDFMFTTYTAIHDDQPYSIYYGAHSGVYMKYI